MMSKIAAIDYHPSKIYKKIKYAKIRKDMQKVLMQRNQIRKNGGDKICKMLAQPFKVTLFRTSHLTIKRTP